MLRLDPAMMSFSCVPSAWNAHESELRNYLRHRSGDAQLADDLLQEVFIKAMQQGRQFCSPDNSRPAMLSFHCKTLSHAGLVESRQDGRFIYYAANFAAMNGMVDYLTENCCGGNADACKVPGRKC